MIAIFNQTEVTCEKVKSSPQRGLFCALYGASGGKCCETCSSSPESKWPNIRNYNSETQTLANWQDIFFFIITAENVEDDKNAGTCEENLQAVFSTEIGNVRCSDMTSYPANYFCREYKTECCDSCRDVGTIDLNWSPLNNHMLQVFSIRYRMSGRSVGDISAQRPSHMLTTRSSISVPLQRWLPRIRLLLELSHHKHR